jgi:adenine-specific DNA-methyltransferase
MRYEIFGITPSSGQWRWGKDRSDKAIENYARLTNEIGENPTDEQIDEWYQKQGGDIDLLRLSSTGKPEHYIAPTNSTLLNSSWMDLMVTSSSELTALFGEKVFDMPKSPEVIKRMLGFTTKDALILDFFSGSGSTAHAIMEANAEDGGNRKFIMVQLPETCAEDSEAVKAGYKTICEIGKERIRRAGKKIAEELAAKNAELAKKNEQGELGLENPDNPVNPVEKEIPDIGFRVLKLDTSSLRDTSATVSETNQEFANFERVRSDRSAEDLLFQMLLETHIPLSESIVKAKVSGNEVLFVGCDGEGAAATSGAPLAACLDAKAKMTTEFFIEIAKLKPGIVFFRDDAFVDDSARTNLQQVFNQFSPTTSIKVI